MRPPREDCRLCSEADLATRALAGRAEAWDEIVHRHSHRVRLALLARGVRWDATDDLVQETWVRLVQQQRAGRLTVLVLPGLAIAQAGWLAREGQRTHARREALAGTVPGVGFRLDDVIDLTVEADPERLAIRNERLRLVSRELAACPPRVQQIFRAVYGGEARAYADVALEFGLSVQRLRQMMCETRARLRTALAGLESEDETWTT